MRTPILRRAPIVAGVCGLSAEKSRQMRAGTIALTLTTFVLSLVASTAQAAPTQVNVRIEGKTRTLFEGPIWTEGHDVHSSGSGGGSAAEDAEEHPCDGVNSLDPENTAPGPTPTAASFDAMELIGETEEMAGQWYPGFNDYFIKRWGSEEENAEHESKSWGVVVNNVYTNVGGCQYELHTGDEVLWIFNAFQSRPILALFAAGSHYTSGVRPLAATAELGRPFEVEVAAYDDDGEDKPPATPERTSKNTKPYAGAEVAPVQTSEKGFETVQRESAETVTTNSEGKASITFTTPGWHRIMAGSPLKPQTEEEIGRGAIPEEKAIRSNRLDVCVPATGQTGCGELPAEDQVRTPPRYEQKSAPESGTPGSEEVHEETHASSGGVTTVQASGSQSDNSSGSSSSGSSSTTKSPEAPVQNTTPTGVQLTDASINPTRLVLDLTAPGVATVKIARQSGKGHHRHLQTVKTITVRASKAGVLEVKLPRLAAGSYQVSISLTGAKTVVKTLTVSRR
jgi:hypothetical protein